MGLLVDLTVRLLVALTVRLLVNLTVRLLVNLTVRLLVDLTFRLLVDLTFRLLVDLTVHLPAHLLVKHHLGKVLQVGRAAQRRAQTQRRHKKARRTPTDGDRGVARKKTSFSIHSGSPLQQTSSNTMTDFWSGWQVQRMHKVH